MSTIVAQESKYVDLQSSQTQHRNVAQLLDLSPSLTFLEDTSQVYYDAAFYPENHKTWTDHLEAGPMLQRLTARNYQPKFQLQKGIFPASP
jgi:hypothetical protein